MKLKYTLDPAYKQFSKTEDSATTIIILCTKIIHRNHFNVKKFRLQQISLNNGSLVVCFNIVSMVIVTVIVTLS